MRTFLLAIKYHIIYSSLYKIRQLYAVKHKILFENHQIFVPAH